MPAFKHTQCQRRQRAYSSAVVLREARVYDQTNKLKYSQTCIHENKEQMQNLRAFLLHVQRIEKKKIVNINTLSGQRQEIVKG